MTVQLDSGITAIQFLVGDKATGVAGYIWRLGWSRNSFYIKPTWKPLSGLKISLHGPDDDHPGSMFLAGNDKSALPGAGKAGGAWSGPEHRRPFPGREVTEGVVHAVTIRTTWDMFEAGAPSGPGPQDLKRNTVGGMIERPSLLNAADVDLFVSEREPYWPNEQQARADNACLGPLRSAAGHWLTGVSAHRSVFRMRPPTDQFAVPLTPADRVRGLATINDPAGFLWVVERWHHVGILEEPRRNSLPLDQWVDGPSVFRANGRTRAAASVVTPGE